MKLLIVLSTLGINVLHLNAFMICNKVNVDLKIVVIFHWIYVILQKLININVLKINHNVNLQVNVQTYLM